ncbi:MAG: lipopolysaccharide heptosyltransferase II [Zavarzinella sp.]
MQSTNYQRIAFFLPNWIGDLVMATPAIAAVAQKYPQAELIAIGKPYVFATLSGNPWFSHNIMLDKKGPPEQRARAVIRQLKALSPDAAVLFPNSFRAAWIAWRAGCRQRIGFVRYARGLLLTDKFYHQRGRFGKPIPMPVIDDYNRLIAPLGITNPDCRMQLFTTADEEQSADALWTKLGLNRYKTVICINSSGAFGAAKLWPSAHFAELAKKLLQHLPDAAVLVVCGPNEKKIAEEITSTANDPRVISLANEKVSIGLTKACIRRSQMLISTDSGPRHFGAAFGIPVVSLFGPTHIEWTDTHYVDEVHLQKKVPCGPCQKRVCPLDHRCMTQLSSEEVLTTALDLFQRAKRRKVPLA